MARRLGYSPACDARLPGRQPSPPKRMKPVIPGVPAVLLLGALLPAGAVLAEPRIVLGPSGPGEEPEVVETISGLSYDQLKRLRELRRWLEQRQMIREQTRLSRPENRQQARNGSLFNDRQLFAPLGQRFAGKLPEPPPDPATLSLPPLPRFAAKGESLDAPAATTDPAEPALSGDAAEARADNAVGRITHITPPSDGTQIEYELNPADR